MYYVIYAKDKPNSLAKRLESRPLHLARLEALKDQGKLLVAGPMPAIDSEDPGEAGFTGSVIIADFESLEDAETWASKDPYLTADVYEEVKVSPFKFVLP